LFNGGCTNSTGDDGGGDGGEAIATREAAEAAFHLLASAGSEVDGKVVVDFTGTVSVEGEAGSVSVTGTKTRTTTSSASSSTTTAVSDLDLTLVSFVPASRTDGSVSGDMRWYDYYYSRTACSDSGCASSTDHSEYIYGTAVAVRFEYAGVTYSDVVEITARSPEDSSQWDVDVTAADGTVYSFTSY
jgi:hypothetical protein